jgi:arylsulfatase
MKTLGVGAAAFLSSKMDAKPLIPPNIIICMTDDQGFGDIGFHGNPDIQTPVLDNLARRSVRFNNFYVSPVCAPTRASLMTGRYSLRTGVFDTYNGGAIMAEQEKTLAELLQSAGYITGIFGKWHLGDNYPFRPMDRGFQHSLIHCAGGIGQVGDVRNYFKFDKSYFDPFLLKDGQPVKTRGYCSDVFTDAAIAFIKQKRNRPFFLYLSFNAPHTPLQVPDEYYQKYKGLVPSPDRYPSMGQPFPDMNEREIEVARKVYAMVTNIDYNLGRLFQTLNQLDLSSNTAVIFLTDNGPQQRRYVAGLRGRKGSVFEGGVKVPCFMRLPGRLPENLEIDTPAAHIDLFPTVLALCGIPAADDILIDGKTLLPVVDKKPMDWADRPLFFHWQRGFPEPYNNIAVRKGRYKLVGKSSHGASEKAFELFDLEKDPYELENIQAIHPGITSDLIAEFDTWYEEMMESPHLRQIQRMKLGTRHENPVILNRNDAKGSEGIWAQDKIYGYWDVEVTEDGLYDFSFHFKEKVIGEGVVKLRMGTLQRSLENADTEASILRLKSIHLKKGNYRLEPWYRAQGENYFPFYVEVKKRQ